MSTIEHGTATGVSFALTDEQKALRELAREFAAKEIRPKEREYDEQMHHPADVVAKAHEVGLMNLHVPEEYGGPGLSTLRGDARRRGAVLGLLGHGHVDHRERPRRRPGDRVRAATSRRRSGCRR